MRAKVVSFINLKGGVAKTTTTVGTAETLAARGKKVLVIDLDPQMNGTYMLLGEERWKTLNAQGLTLATLFRDALEARSDFDLWGTLQRKGVSDVWEAWETLSLLPSSLDLVDLQRRLPTMPRGEFGERSPWRLLRNALGAVTEGYDYV